MDNSLNLSLRLQSRDPVSGAPSTSSLDIPTSKIAVVLVDVWTQHYCKGATDWPALMIPGWNQLFQACREVGIQVVFASAGDDLKRWEGKPQRTTVTGMANVPMPQSNGFLAGHGMYGPWPTPCMCVVHQLDPKTGEPVFDCQLQAMNANQDPRIVVGDNDLFIAAGHYVPADIPSAIASWGQLVQQELWNLCQARGITHLLYAGDATNMCVINREFSMIQMRRLGLNTVIVRDLTNAMTFHGYDPEKKKLDPEFTPEHGTLKAVEYIEQKIGPSIDSQDIINLAASRPGSKVRRRNNRLPFGEFSGEKVSTFVEPVAVADYQYAGEKAYDDFDDLKYGVRLHWGLYTLKELEASWPLLHMSNKQRQDYQQLYQSFNPKQFDANAWMKLFSDNGLKMFAITTKHHEGFSLYDTKTRVKQRVNWTAVPQPVIEDCDVAYSVMETPFQRDIIRELCDAARRFGVAIDLYFSHPDWYDADFRTYGYAPMQTPEAKDILIPGEVERIPKFQRLGGSEPTPTMGPNHTPQQRARMLQRHRDQLTELLTNYGPIRMMCLDQWMAGDLWPAMRNTMIELRKIQPDVMFRARGIGNYGDYFTNEGFIPEEKQGTNMPSFVTYALANASAYDPDDYHYHGGDWVVHNLVDTVAKGGNFMLCIGPDKNGLFHPLATKAITEAGAWLKINGEAIYGTRYRDGAPWKQGDDIRITHSKDGKSAYAVCLKWPGEKLTLTGVNPRAESKIQLLGSDSPLAWQAKDGGVAIEIPESLQNTAARPCQYAWVFRIDV